MYLDHQTNVIELDNSSASLNNQVEPGSLYLSKIKKNH